MLPKVISVENDTWGLHVTLTHVLLTVDGAGGGRRSAGGRPVGSTMTRAGWRCARGRSGAGRWPEVRRRRSSRGRLGRRWGAGAWRRKTGVALQLAVSGGSARARHGCPPRREAERHAAPLPWLPVAQGRSA